MSKKPSKPRVPKLRFPEFHDSGEWDNPSLGDISERLTAKVGDSALTPVSISAGIGFVSQKEKFGRRIAGKQYKNYIILNKGDFSYNKGNSKKYPQGCVYKLKEFDQVAAPNAFISFRFKEGLVPDFYQGYFDSNYHGKQLIKFITSGARSDGLLNINADDFFSINLPTPKDKAEAPKIAACLTSLDDLIRAHREKLQALQDHKKGLLQQLFPAEGETVPKLRFPGFEGEWEEDRFGNLIKVVSGKGFKASEYTNSGIRLLQIENVGYGLTKWGDKKVFLPKGYSIEHSNLVLKHGDIVLALNRPITNDQLKIAQLTIHDTPSILYQRVGKLVIQSKSLNRDFAFYACQHFIKNFVIKGSIGSDQPFISLKELYAQDFPLPTLPEQYKLTGILSSIDTIITSHTQQLAALQTHKKGLTQQLFPSD